MKFLVIQTAFIGDVILATPVVEKLHQHFPEASIDFLLRKGNQSLLDNHPYIRKVLIFDKSQKFSSLQKLISTIRKEKYDKVINLQRFFSSGLISVLSAGREVIGFDKNPLAFFYHKKLPHLISENTGDDHEVNRNLSLVEDFTDADFQTPKLYPSIEDFEKVKFNGSYVTIAPASIWYTKQWPANQWINLINKIPEKVKVFLIGGKTDFELCQLIQQKCKRSNIDNKAGTLSLLASAALMKNAKMNYVNDSAPLHLASAVNAPVTAVFCSTVPQFGFGPLSEVSFIAQTHHTLSCRPCGLHGKSTCPEGHFKCSEINIKNFDYSGVDSRSSNI